MSVYKFLLLQFIAHLLSDFIFQNEKWATLKNQIGFKSKNLKWHILITFLFSLCLSFQLNFIFYSLAIALSHWLIDGFKIKLKPCKELDKYIFFIDQALHIIIIISIVFVFNHYYILKPVFNLNTYVTTLRILIIAGYILCIKPSNIIIKEIFHVYNISVPKNNNEDIPNAGKLIGIVERILALTLVLYGQYEAVGFLIAGKSILRFKDSDISKTEYVLVGTLLSFGIAILTGIAIQILK